METILNLFADSNNLTKNNPLINGISDYSYKKDNSFSLTPALIQGKKFKGYQGKIKKHLEEKEMIVKEGFTQNPRKPLNNVSLTKQTQKVLNKTKIGNSHNIQQVQEEYNNTLAQYENLLAQLSGSTSGYLTRINPKENHFLGKNIKIGNQFMYVTQQGIAKWYPDSKVLQNTAGKNGCPASSQIIDTNLSWSTNYETNGATIPTTPPLITGTPMTSGQSCGNEGHNIYINSMLNPSQPVTPNYVGCFQDSATSPTMTYIGPTPPSQAVVPVNFINGNFASPVTNGFSSTGNKIPGWSFNTSAYISSEASAKTTTPFPNGSSQCIILVGNQGMSQTLNLSPNVTYTLTFSASNCFFIANSTASNPISIEIQNSGTSTVVQPPQNSWKNYSFEFSPNQMTQGNTTSCIFVFQGMATSQLASAITNITIKSNNNLPPYSYDQCKQAAIDGGYQYFALQNVNTQNSLGYCAVTNNLKSAEQNGESFVPTAMFPLWASNTPGQSGNTAILTNTGALSVLNSTGAAIFNTPYSNAQPSNYLGCYGDGPNRAMPLYNGGAQIYNNAQCQQIAQQNGAAYYGLQNSTSGTTAQCAISSNLGQTMEYGTAGNCTKIGDGSYSGGGWSNAVYNTNLPQSNYFLILQDDGNLCIYRGSGPNDNQGYVWCAMTNGKAQKANPAYAAAKGKFGQNWISSGSTMAAGDFIGSNSGNMALMMQSDGNLVLYTFQNKINCQTMKDNNMGGGVEANALYNNYIKGIKQNMGQMAYIDENSELHMYPSDNRKLTNSYTTYENTDSAGNDIPGAAYGNSTVEQCESSCNNNKNCYGYTFDTRDGRNTCNPKNSSTYPVGQRSLVTGVNLFVKNVEPEATPISVSNSTTNTDTLTYQHYVNGGAMGNEYGLSNATAQQQQALKKMQARLTELSNILNNETNTFQNHDQQVNQQGTKNMFGLNNYLNEIQTTNEKITNFSSNVDNILNDSDIVVLQHNYNYLFWSILAAGTVLVTMNIVKK